MRGSILGLLIALYEGDGAVPDTDDGPGDDGHGGARSLASSGLKWLLRFVSALVDGAPRVGGATKSATSGFPVQRSSSGTSSSPAQPDSASLEVYDSGDVDLLPRRHPRPMLPLSARPFEENCCMLWRRSRAQEVKP